MKKPKKKIEEIDTSAQVADIFLPNCVINASGPSDTTYEDLEKIAESKSGAIIMKSCTINGRAGNTAPRYFKNEFGSIQSMGLPNLGYKKYIEYSKILNSFNKPIIASIAGLKPDDYETMLKAFQNSEVDAVEINLSCPNISGKGQLAYDIEATEKLLKKLQKYDKKIIGLKLPAFLENYYFDKYAKITNKYQISFVTCINSIAGSLIIDIEKESSTIKPNGGMGGLCGDYIKPVALGNVRKFYKSLEKKVKIFGVGGIKNGVDVYEYILAGAEAVQVGTQFETEGAECFQRINDELCLMMKKKGCKRLKKFRGKLKN